MEDRVIFRKPELSDIVELENNFNDCPFTGDFKDDIHDNARDDIRILIINDEIVGIEKFYNIWANTHTLTERKKDIKTVWPNIYYIETRCTKDKPENFQRVIGLKTPGRLLWAYILREIYLLHVRNRLKKSLFVAFNVPRQSARGYHLKMGMNAASQIKIDEKRNLRDLVFRSFKRHKEELKNYNASIFHDKKQRDDDYLLAKFDENYMFYIKQPNVDYYSIDSILKSLPSPSDGTLEAVAERKTDAEIEAVETEPERKAEVVAVAEAAETEPERKATGVVVGGIKTKNRKTKNRK